MKQTENKYIKRNQRKPHEGKIIDRDVDARPKAGVGRRCTGKKAAKLGEENSRVVTAKSGKMASHKYRGGASKLRRNRRTRVFLLYSSTTSCVSATAYLLSVTARLLSRLKLAAVSYGGYSQVLLPAAIIIFISLSALCFLRISAQNKLSPSNASHDILFHAYFILLAPCDSAQTSRGSFCCAKVAACR